MTEVQEHRLREIDIEVAQSQREFAQAQLKGYLPAPPSIETA